MSRTLKRSVLFSAALFFIITQPRSGYPLSFDFTPSQITYTDRNTPLTDVGTSSSSLKVGDEADNVPDINGEYDYIHSCRLYMRFPVSSLQSSLSGLPIASATVSLAETGREFDNIATTEPINVRQVTGLGAGYSADTYLINLTWDGQSDAGITYGTVYASSDLTPDNDGGTKTWSGTLDQLVSGWIDGSITNYGIVLENDFDSTWSKITPGDPNSKYNITSPAHMNEVETIFSKSSARLRVVTRPVISGVSYNHATHNLTITFNESINAGTFTAANLANLSIQDGITTVVLSGATINTASNAPIMEAKLSDAAAAALNTIKENVLRLVVGASCGIKNLDGYEPSSNTYATSTLRVTDTALTGTLKDSKSSLVIAKAAVKLYDSDGNLKAETVSDTGGNFSLNTSVPSGTYTLVVTKLPQFKDLRQTVTITAHTVADTGTLLIDPYGIVYDSVTGSPIAGATVTLYTASGSVYTGCPEPNPQNSRADGSYNFNVAPGMYYLTALKEGYADYTGAMFTVTTEIVEWNIPMDSNNQAGSAYLSISQQANKKTAAAGDIITYTIDIKNLSNTLEARGMSVTAALPQGFKYVEGSTLIDGAAAADPSGLKTLVWSAGNLATQASKKLTYRARVTFEAPVGRHENKAFVSATVNGLSAGAGPSTATVEVREGLFTDRGLLIGKVFEDKNGNGIQDDFEPGLPGVSLVLEDGTVIVTDEFGRYSVPNVKKGSHVIRLDQRVLPGGPFNKPKTERVPEKPRTISPSFAQRSSIFDLRRLDTWRKQVLARSRVVEEKEKKAAEQAVQKKQALSRRLTAYSYTGFNRQGEKIMGLLDARSVTDAADKLHAQGVEVATIEKYVDRYAEDEPAEDPAPEAETVAPARPETVITETHPGVVSSIRRTPRQELLKRYGDPEGGAKKERGVYRADVPKESKFFKIYGSETAKVNFPVRLLSGEDAEKEQEKDEKPTQFMLVGLADGTLGYMSASGNVSNLESSVNGPYEEKIYEDGSIKMYLKGVIKGEYLLTGAVDTDKDKNSHLFEYVNPEKYYPVYGDSSSHFNETDTSGKFFVRIDKDESYGMWGNYDTQEFTRTEFTRYNRTLAGAKTHLELKDWMKDPESMPVKPELDVFYAHSNQEQVSEVFAAKGLSGPFWLGKNPVLEYAEAIRIETRDRDRSDVVLRTRVLARDVDYEIDYDSGRIFFKEPIPSSDENDDPNFIVVDYEYVPLSDMNKYYYSGARLETRLFGDKLMLGGQYVGENHVSHNPQLYGFDTVLQPDPGTRLAAEWGRSGRYLDSDNRTPLRSDNAWKVEAEKTLGRLNLQGYYSDIGNRFRNPVNITEKGREKYGGTADYALTDSTNVVLDHWRNYSSLAKTFDRSTSLDVYHAKEDYFLSGGYAFKDYQDRQQLTPDTDVNTVNLRAGRKLTERIVGSLEEEYEHEAQNNTGSALDNKTYATTGRLDYKVSQDSSVYLKQRFITELHNQYRNATGLGFMRNTPEGDAFVEYGFGGKTAETTFGLRREQSLNDRMTLSSYTSSCISSDKNEENVGFGTTYELMRGLFTRFNFENTRSKNSDTSYYKQNSQSVAFDYLPSDTEDSYGVKYERRKATLEHEQNIFGYIKHCISKTLTFLCNLESVGERSGEDSIRTGRKAVLGLAYRPVFNDKLNMLSKYEYNDEMDHTAGASSTEQYNHITSLEATYELSPKMDVFGKYALKFQREKDLGLVDDAVIDMITTRYTYKLTEIFDIGAYYRIINDRDSRVVKQAPALELGCLFLKKIRLGVGFNFLEYVDKYNSDEGYNGVGPYFNVSAKF